jgi:glutathione S-transferase
MTPVPSARCGRWRNLDLAYDLKLLPFPPRFRAREFLDENPLGTIPLLVDGDTRMTESAAMIEYLSMRHGGGALSVMPDEPGYGAYLNGLHFGEATLTFPRPWCCAIRVWSPRNAASPRWRPTTRAGSWRA